MQHAAGIVLAGGRSTRMGSPKAALEWHGSTLLRRIVGILARALDGPVIVVGAPGQSLPALPSWVEVVHDRHAGRGPLEGIAVGLGAVTGRAELAYVSATDLPLLHPEFVRAVVGALSAAGQACGAEPAVALPNARGHRQPLAAAYRTSLAQLAQALVEQGAPGPASLLRRITVRELDADTLLADERLAGADPSLCSLVNVNEPDDYRLLCARPEPEVLIRTSGTLGEAQSGAPTSMRVRAATLGAAASAAGLVLREQSAVALNWVPVEADPQLPLVAGDVVTVWEGRSDRVGRRRHA